MDNLGILALWISQQEPADALHNQGRLLGVTWSMTGLNVVLLMASIYLVFRVYRMV